jgi:hypothetical protein
LSQHLAALQICDISLSSQVLPTLTHPDPSDACYLLESV